VNIVFCFTGTTYGYVWNIRDVSTSGSPRPRHRAIDVLLCIDCLCRCYLLCTIRINDPPGLSNRKTMRSQIMAVTGRYKVYFNNDVIPIITYPVVYIYDIILFVYNVLRSAITTLIK